MTNRNGPQKQTPPPAYPEAAEAGATGRRVATFAIACVLMAVAYWQFEQRQSHEATPSQPGTGEAVQAPAEPASSPEARP